jgi:predicted amidohydrolase
MKVTLAAIQIAVGPAATGDRIAEIDARLGEAARRGARLAALPEMSLYGYELSDLLFRRAEPVPGPSTDVLHTLARRHDLIVVAGLTEVEGGDFYNTLAVVGPDGFLGRCRKMHVSAQENAFWKCADAPAPIATDLGCLGLGICADMLHPTPWRHYRGAVDLVVICAAWPDLREVRRMPLPRRFRNLHLSVTREVPEKISRLLGVPVVFANACGVRLAAARNVGSASGALWRALSHRRRCHARGRRRSGGTHVAHGRGGARRTPPNGRLLGRCLAPTRRARVPQRSHAG